MAKITQIDNSGLTAPSPKRLATVALVGAGPGDPALLTLRGKTLLERADVVVYDALVNARILGHCHPQAELIFVGKRAAAHSMSQAEINALLIGKASGGEAGKRVVRLKGGDPFVFGRGGEECEALAGAGIPFEVVPGITAAIAGPAYAGIPVTHRDFNSSFTLITGHEKEEAYRDPQAHARDAAVGSSDVDWSAIAKLPCVAFYMGVKSLDRICAKLLEHGMRADMPAAIVQWGTLPRQRCVTSTLAQLAEDAQAAGIAAPAITIIGRVVELRKTVNWFESRPLFGQTVAVTRTREQASELVEKLEALGAQVYEAATIELATPTTFHEIDKALLSLATVNPTDGAPAFNWAVFTSANGVRAAKRRLLELDLDARAFGKHLKIAAIGDATARAITEELALRVDLCPQEFVAEALADALVASNEVAGKRFVLLRADIARPVLREKLIEHGAAEALDVPIYETKRVEKLPPEMLAALRAGEVDWITFTSSSTATNLISLLGGEAPQLLGNVKFASIGPVTTATLNAAGFPPTVQATTFNIDGLVEALAGAVRAAPPERRGQLR